MKKKLFINDDFISSQYLWLIPIIDGYCKRNKIENIILLKKFPQNILNHENIKKFINKYKVEIIENNNDFIFTKILKYFFVFLKNINLISKLFIKSPLENKNDWYHLQIDHSLWDYTNILLKENKLEKNLILKIYSYLTCVKKIDLGKKLVKKKITHAFIGHSVYFSRALMAVLRKNDIKVFNQTNFTIYKQPKTQDTFWSEIKKNEFLKLNKKISDKESEKYWKKRVVGLGTYKDTQIALNLVKKQKITDRNFIFLHIFKDSPFNLIDKTRIFDDYFHWFTETIKIINNSNENWYIKFHPSHKLWGENQKIILQTLLKKNNIKLNNNIKIEKFKLSNQAIFKNAKRIVTFSGTPHLEVAAYGIRPIVISKNTLETFDKRMVLKPNSLKMYRKTLLSSSDSDIFKLDKKSKNLARKLLFIRENILSLKEDLKSFITYRKDTNENIKKEFNIVKSNSRLYYNQLFSLGYNLNKINKTKSFKYINFLK